jgi:drug/metabolite transporter (DMT)-like permease
MGASRKGPSDGQIKFEGPASLLAVITMLLFGSGFWALVVVLKDIPPVTLGLVRALLVFLFMGSLLLIFGKRYFKGMDLNIHTILRAGIKGRGAILIAVAIGIFSTTLPNIFQNIGMTIMDPGSTSSLSALIQGSSPAFTIVMAVFLLKEKMSIWKIMGLSLVIPATVILIMFGKDGFEINSMNSLGALFNLLTALSYSISGILLKAAMNRKGKPLLLVTANSFFGVLFLIPITFILVATGTESVNWIGGVSVEGLLALLYCSIGLYGIMAILWYQLINRSELSRITFFIFLIPLFSYFIGYIMLGERLTSAQLIAGLILLAGVGISQVRGKVINPNINMDSPQER